MQPSKRSISLITYNIHKGFGVGAVRFLLPEMRSALTNLNPDFVFLQEVQGKHKRREKRINSWPDSPQTQYIAEDIWPHYIYAKNLPLNFCTMHKAKTQRYIYIYVYTNIRIHVYIYCILIIYR